MDVDWPTVLQPETPLLELIVRGTVVYLALFLMLRFLLKRASGYLSLSDLLLVVLIADAAQNAMADDYVSIPDGLILVSVLVGWNFALDALAFYFKPLRWLIHPPPHPIVKDGRLLRDNMRKQLVSFEELMSQLRANGLDDITRVKLACVEGDGHISIIKYES